MADRRGDSNAVRRFFRAMEKSSKIAGMIMSVILIFVAVSIFVSASRRRPVRRLPSLLKLAPLPCMPQMPHNLGTRILGLL